MPPRLKRLAPTLSTLPPRVGFGVGEHDKTREADTPWRAWYRSKRWQELRLAVLVRDNWTCQRTGRVLTGRYPSPDSPVVDHRIPHKGNAALFWDMGNLQTLSKEYHDKVKQAEERNSIDDSA